MSANQLSQATSPYLLQHADNPVHWRLWGPAALAEAKALGRPILLSIGYAACHWCHVMAHESFEDKNTAAVMNELFVPIKVDREERPDIDAIYMNALHLLGIPGGWPLTMFLTPEGEPFWGGTYYPPTAHHGRPAFTDVLRAVHRAFKDDGDTVQKNKSAMLEALKAMGRPGPKATLAEDFPERAAAHLLTQMDPLDGGLSGAPKFPQTGLLELLWRMSARRGEAGMADAVHNALTHMGQGGIYDHLGGGFARYSVDARWLVPHFEKMLYDNAALIELMSLVWLGAPRPLYARRVTETVGFVLRELRTEGGAFAASLDADSEGEEGRFYVWTAAEIADVLGAEAPSFGAAYGVTQQGNWEDGQNILNRLDRLELGTDEAERALEAARARLFARRAHRVRPGFDDKMLSDWNGLMIAALARAGIVFTRTDWIRAAEEAFAGVMRLMSFEQEGMLRLCQSYRAGRAQHAGVADSYANLARAALVLAEAGGGASYVDLARRLAASLDRYFRDEASGGYFYTACDAEALIVRSRFAHDQPLPNANGVMIEVLARLYHETGAPAYRARGEALIEAFAAEASRNPLAHGAYLNGASFSRNAWQILIYGAVDDPGAIALHEAAKRLPRIEKMVRRMSEADMLPADHPAAGTAPAGGRPTAYVCVGTRCSLPLHDPAALAELQI